MKNSIVLLALALLACSDTYRYPCQDPAKHNTLPCQPPACEASGTCTKYLIKGETNEV
jgi:hypothetical protein